VQRFIKYFCIAAGWAANGHSASRNAKEKTSQAVARRQKKDSPVIHILLTPLGYNMTNWRKEL
jgi:hypothetical protein